MQEWSAYGVAEFMTWSRALSRRELDEAQAYMTTKYGLKDGAPPAPPVPAAPQPPQPPLASSLAQGMVAWYNMAGYKAATPLSGTWTSAVGGGAFSTSVNQVDIETDAVGVAANSVPVTYISGPATTKIIFPEQYGNGDMLQFSICTVTRYTSALNRNRIFQQHLGQLDFLHGHWCVQQLLQMRCAAHFNAFSTRSRSAPGTGTAALHVRARSHASLPVSLC